jgi:hypothetical protein
VLGKDPSDVSVSSLLYGVGSVFALDHSELYVSERSLSARKETYERVVWETVEQRCFSDDLVDRVLDRWCSSVGNRVEVKS